MKFYDLLKRCKETPSSNDKIDILVDFFDNHDSDDDVRLLKYYIDPQFVCYFDKAMLKKVNNTKSDLFSGHGAMDYIILLETLANRTISGNCAIQVCANTLNSCADEQIYEFETVLLKTPHGISYKTVNKAYQRIFGENFIDIFECQLANSYKPEKNYKTDEWFISPKLDGLRCVYRDGRLFTRQNKPIIGFDNTILKECQEIAEKYSLDMIDGELYSHDIDFHTIQGIVTRNKNVDPEQKKKINFNVFACASGMIETTCDMMIKINSIQEQEFEYITCVSQTFIKNDYDLIKIMTEQYVQLGYEGSMLRSATKYYDYKRSDALLKVKFFQEDDFIITGTFEGEGKYEGMLGGVYILSKDGTIECKVGSGFDDDFRNEYFNNDIIGLFAEIKYFDITPKNKLRFPVFLKLKEDR